MPYTLGIRDSIMIAHSFHDHPAFGPAGKLHGATYTCDVEFITDKLQEKVNWVLDIGYASELLSDVLSKYNMKNLDEVFKDGEFTTTEFMARRIHRDLAERLRKCNHVNNEDSVKVIMNIDKTFDIPSDSKALIQATDFLGSKAIVIQKGNSKQMAEDGSLILGVYDEGTLSELQQKGLSLGDSVAEVGENLNKVLKNLNETLSDGVKADVQKSVSELNAVTSESRKLIQENRKVVKNTLESLENMIAQADSLTTENRPEIKKLIQNGNYDLCILGADILPKHKRPLFECQEEFINKYLPEFFVNIPIPLIIDFGNDDNTVTIAL
jgi:6-pyruvoyl-tetrahydropterin synthase